MIKLLPSKVRIAGIEYDVVQVDKLAEDHGLGGQIVYSRGIIKIDANLCQDKKEQVLVHEILHGVFIESGFDEHEEDMVNRLGITLHQVLKDNKIYFGD